MIARRRALIALYLAGVAMPRSRRARAGDQSEVARALGITIPSEVMLLADEVIQ